MKTQRCFVQATLLVIALLVACDARVVPTLLEPRTNGIKDMPRHATIKLGQTSKHFVDSNRPLQVDVDRQPAGLNFYKIRWTVRQPGSVRVEAGRHSFEIASALSVMGTENAAHPELGLDTLEVNAGITDPDTISHQEARDRIMALLGRLQATGWRRSMARSDPRFSGPEAIRQSVAEIGTYPLDPTYTPTPQEWMAFGAHAMWELWADGAYLTLNLHRDTERMDPNKPGAYFLSFDLHTEAQDLRLYFAPEDRARWRELWPEREKRAVRERAEAEAKARAEGRTVDEHYEDPPVLAAR